MQDNLKPPPAKSYDEYMQSPEWFEKRREALERAGNKCQLCSKTDHLEVHHNTYARFFRELPTDLVVLCEECHALFHARHRRANVVRRFIDSAPKVHPSVPRPDGRDFDEPWYNTLPEWLLPDHMRLSPSERVILQVIANRCDKRPIDMAGSLGYGIVGFGDLGELTGMHSRTVIRYVKRLCGAGMLVVVRKGGIDLETGKVYANIYAIPGRPNVEPPAPVAFARSA